MVKYDTCTRTEQKHSHYGGATNCDAAKNTSTVDSNGVPVKVLTTCKIKAWVIESRNISKTSSVVGAVDDSEYVNSEKSKFMYILKFSGLGGIPVLRPNNVKSFDVSAPKNCTSVLFAQSAMNCISNQSLIRISISSYSACVGSRVAPGATNEIQQSSTKTICTGTGVGFSGIGAIDGLSDGTTVGPTDGAGLVGAIDGATVGTAVGATIGVAVGATVGVAVGAAVGATVGVDVGAPVGASVVGPITGVKVGTSVTVAALGANEGSSVATVGVFVGSPATTGEIVGAAVGASVAVH